MYFHLSCTRVWLEKRNISPFTPGKKKEVSTDSVTGTVQATWHVLEHGMSLGKALGERRVHDQLMPDVTTFERGFDEGVVEGMEKRGHNWTWVEPGEVRCRAS